MEQVMEELVKKETSARLKGGGQRGGEKKNSVERECRREWGDC